MGCVLIFCNVLPPEGGKLFQYEDIRRDRLPVVSGVCSVDRLFCDVYLSLHCHLLFIFWLLCGVEELSIDTRNYVRRSDVHRVH